MATRKNKAKKAAPTGVIARRARGAMRAIESELPTNLREYVKQVETRLGRLEGRLEKAGADAQKQGMKIYRDARKQLAELEASGEAAWARLTAAARKEAASLIDQLEAALAPATKAATKVAKQARRAAKKVTKRATKAAKKAVARAKPAAKKPARRRRKKKA
jgi:molecular chaperone DnaK (HSP70)